MWAQAQELHVVGMSPTTAARALSESESPTLGLGKSPSLVRDSESLTFDL